MSRPGKTLEDLGWDDSWREALLSTPPPGDAAPTGEEHGRIVRVDRGLCTVATADGPIRASLGSDVLEEIAVEPTRAPCAGDWCVVRHWPDGPVTVERLAARRTSVMRAGAARSSHGQVLAANVDLVGLVVALHPEPNVGRLERLLAVAWQSGATPVILLTKADLVTDGEAVAEEVRAVAPGVDVLSCSAMTFLGVDEIRGMVSGGRTMALVGASGHGKSTLANAVLGCDALTTRPIRDDGRGRHTSVRRELLPVPTGGSVIDTPGLRGVGLQTDREALDATFADIAGLTMACRFRDCRHLGEPGCAVHAAVGSGALAVRRWESWQKLRRELASAQTRTERRLRAQLGAGWRSGAKGPDVRRTRRPG